MTDILCMQKFCSVKLDVLTNKLQLFATNFCITLKLNWVILEVSSTDIRMLNIFLFIHGLLY